MLLTEDGVGLLDETSEMRSDFKVHVLFLHNLLLTLFHAFLDKGLELFLLKGEADLMKVKRDNVRKALLH